MVCAENTHYIPQGRSIIIMNLIFVIYVVVALVVRP